MNIRKMIATFILGFAMAVGSQLCINHAAYAEDVWAYSSEWGDDYVMTETIRTEKEKYGKTVWVNVKHVKNEKVKIHTVAFRLYKNDNYFCAQTGTGFKDVGETEKHPYGRALWNVVKNYI